MPENAVQKIGKYDVLEVLGQGGMGIVYKAVDSKIGRPVAIKMMTGGYAENPDLLKRFYREAQASGMLQHRNIVTIYDLGDEGGNPYMVMEFIAGESLEDMIAKRKRMTMVEKLDVMIQILSGLEYAHKHGIVHRDIKPANIMLLQDGTVKIVDFGIARVQDNSMTKTGQIVGTINYMSPEQFNGHVVDGRSDVFSAGVLFYELLTSVLPFEGAETPSVILKILNEPPPPLAEHLQGFPPELETIIQKALAKDREERYASGADFAFDLEKVQDVLKKDLVVEYIDQAKTALDKSELTKAKDMLLQVLKVDTKNIDAVELMKQVQSQLAQQQRHEQLKQLRSAAEDALAAKNFEEALSCIDQALKLDKNNAELAQLQKLAQQGKQKKDQQVRLLNKAKDLREDGDLDAALLKAEEALTLDPADSNAQMLRQAISVEVEKRKKEKELNDLITVARREIADRHYTVALQMIRKAESLSTSATQSNSLRQVLRAAREQEPSRMEVDRLAIEIEVALYRQGTPAASAKAEEALKLHPGEPALHEIQQHARDFAEAAGLGDTPKVLARLEQLRQAHKYEPALAMLERAVGAAPNAALKEALAQTKHESDELTKAAAATVKEAEKLIAQRKVEEAAVLLESKTDEYLRVTQFAQSLARVRAEQDKLNTVESAVLDARALMQKNDITGAWNKAKSLLQENPGSPMVQDFLRELEARRVVVAKEAVEKAIRDAKALVLARQTAAASRTLQQVAPFVPHVSAELKKQFEEVKREAAAGAQHVTDELDSSKTVVAGSAGRAQSSGGGTAVMQQQEAAKPQTAVPAVAPAKPLPMKQIGVAVLVIALAIGGFFGYKKFLGPPPVDSYVEINAVPYATIQSIVTTDGKRTIPLTDDQTPVRVNLPQGEYNITFKGADGKTEVEKVTASPANPVQVSHVMESVSPNEIVQTSK